MPSPFLPLDRFCELNPRQQETLEVVANYFLDARMRPISHIMNISYEDNHMSTLLISSEKHMLDNMFRASPMGNYDHILRLMEQMVGLAGGNDLLQQVFRATFTMNGWDRPLAPLYRIVEGEGCIGFEVQGLAFFVLRTAVPVDLATLSTMNFTRPGLFASLNPLMAADPSMEVH